MPTERLRRGSSPRASAMMLPGILLHRQHECLIGQACLEISSPNELTEDSMETEQKHEKELTEQNGRIQMKNRNRTQTGGRLASLPYQLILMILVAQPCLPATYDAVSEFSATSNPSGSWSYGWESSLGGVFTLNSVTDNNGSVQGVNFWEGPDACGVSVPANGLFPMVGFNNTGATLNYASGVSQPANMLNLHPSCAGKFSVVRWTAPTSGMFNISGLFQGIDTRNTTTDVHILQNSTATLLDAKIIGFGNQAPFSLTRYLAAGDTLDFLVGLLTPGEYCAFCNDSTGLAVTITPTYSVCLLYDVTRVAQNGSTYPVKVQLCDGNGGNLSSSTLTLHAIGVTQTSTSISGPALDSGNANPDSDFRFDPALGSTGGYIFNLSTKGLSTGAYSLNFTVSGAGSSVFGAPFQVK